MIFIWGVRVYGRCDRVPGLFWVATNFWHLWYIPLIPLGSFVVVPRGGPGRGMKIPLCLRSVFLAWIRAALILAILLAGLGIFSALRDRHPPHVGTAIVCIVAATLFAAVCGFTYIIPALGRATYTRAISLAEKIGAPEETLVLLELKYRRITREQAEETLASLRATAEQIRAEEERQDAATAGV